MEIIKYPGREEWSSLIKRPALDVTTLFDTVRTVLDEVREQGDTAVKAYEEKFDKVQLSSLQVSEEEMREADALVAEDLKQAIRTAKANIEKFHASQRFEGKKVETTPGVTCWQKAVAIEKVGLYIPGGTAPLFSTVLMLAVPARIAGCKEIVLCTPPNREGKVHPAILFAAEVAGVSKIFKAGGIQAIAAMAYGTESVPKVYKIFGPGNQYVTAAKQLVSLKEVAIDMPAGPSEVEVIADETANPDFIAADFLSQAEHGVDSQAILVTASETIVEPVARHPRATRSFASKGNYREIISAQPYHRIERFAGSRRLHEPIRSRTLDYPDGGLHRYRGANRERRQCLYGSIYSGKRRRLCFRHESYLADQRLCQGI